MMESEVIAYKAPLYGRASAQYKLRPLPYAALVELFPERTAAERVAIYAVCGGIPAYLELFTRAKSFVTALRDHCLQPGSLLLTDPALILYEQLREPQKYESVLWAVASGHHQWQDITRLSGVAEGSIGHYIKVLTDLEILARRDPVLSRRRGRQGRYTVRDEFLRFYYRFIAPKMSAIEQGHFGVVSQQIHAELRGFIGTHTFERLCREWVWAAAAAGEITWIPEEVGAYWKQQRGEGVQLDVVAANRAERRLLIGEAKWGQGRVGRQVLTDLIARSQRMPQVADGWLVQYVLFAREGFSAAAKEAARERGARLVTLPEMDTTLVAANA
jgi:AAA+ ATPase superfamily predicted ATPase